MKLPGSTIISERRRHQWFWVAFVFVLVVVFGCVEGWLFQLQSDVPSYGNVLLFSLINLNVILLLLLAYLVLRNVVKLIFERKRKILGHKLRTRLVIAFVGLTMIPTIPLFWLATQFIFSSLDHWFTQKVELSLEQGVTLAKDYIEQEKKDLLFDCRLMKAEILRSSSMQDGFLEVPDVLSSSLLEQYHVDAIFQFDAWGNPIGKIKGSPLLRPGAQRLRQLLYEDPDVPEAFSISLKDKQEIVIAHTPLPLRDGSEESPEGKLVVLRAIPVSLTEKFSAIAAGYDDYLQIKMLHNPLKISHFITFSIVTLLVIFAAVWFGFFLAKNITVPIQALVSATQRIAEGDLEVELDSDRTDEIGMLILSFNKMVRDLREGREQLAGAYSALQQSNEELEDRRRYMEIVLKDIAAGVVSVDISGKIMTMNKSAEAIFGIEARQAKGRPYSSMLQESHMELVKSFMDAYRIHRQPYLEQQVQLIIGNRPMVLLAKVSILRDDHDEYVGVVVVLDDLTELEKAQRMAAWREVARRIAHEIKNPLTPIKLSAQRLRRKYDELMQEEDSVLDECTRTIIQQVDHMKLLVDEFSKFARLPQAQLAPCDLTALVEESIALYKHDFPLVSFSQENDAELPRLKLDREQFKRVMINLLNNALHALDGQPGEISIRLFYDPILKIARMECADTGHGLSPEDKLRMFEPYYSTKEKGTGLGLAIVASIVADHNGFIRVRDNTPQGTVIIIELPG